MEQAYDMQQQALELIRRFIDPMEGGMSGQGWQIGELPTPLHAYGIFKNRYGWREYFQNAGHRVGKRTGTSGGQ